MEFGIIIAFGHWGYVTGKSPVARIVLGLGVPFLAFGFWGLVDFRKAGPVAEYLRLTQELVVTGLAAVAWYAAGQHLLGWTLGLTSLVHHLLVYVLGGSLLKN